MSQLTVPKKFASHHVLEEEQKKKTEQETVAKDDDTEPEPVKGEVAEADEEGKEVADESAEQETERPLTESEKAEELEEPAKEESEEEVEPQVSDADGEEVTEEVPETNGKVEASDDNIEQQVKETPIELATQPEAKYEPVELPNQAVLDSLLAKPNLLNRYQELNAAAIGSAAKSLDDPKKVIDLGSGLRLTQQQLLDIAAKRVAPVIATINEEVEKSRQEDKILEKRDLDGKVALHQLKLDKDLDKHKGKLAKLKTKFELEIATKLTNISNKSAAATTAAEEFDVNTKNEIETAKTDFEEREKKAVEQHETDKETLIKNHEELTTTKKQALDDAKTGQETTTTAIEELQEKKSELDNKNSELSTEIDELTEQLNERTKELDELKEKLATEKEKLSTNENTREELNTAIVTTKKGVEDKRAKHSKLSAEVGVLGGAVAAYTAKLAFLKNDKENRSSRLGQAKESFTNWQKEKSDLAEKVAKEHEQKRLEAIEAAETDRVKKEIEEQKQKLEEEKKQYEEERQRLEKEAEERREEEERKRKEEEEKFAAEEQQRKEEYQRKLEEEEKKAEEERQKKEEEEAAAEKKRKEEEDEKERVRLEELRLANDPEHQRLLRIQKREDDRQRLLEEQAEKDRSYNERKQKEQDEFEKLQKEIELLRLQRDARAQAEKEEAERLAQSKLDEIEKLKEEHDAKLALYRQRLDFEALQKQRLEEEVLNLRKIRELREEKSRLTTQVNGDSGLDSIQKLIEERELEVTRLTKQIEYDDDELYKAVHKERSPRPMNAPLSTKDSEKPSSKSNSSGLASGLLGATAGAAVGAGAAAAAGASKASSAVADVATKAPSSNKSVTPSVPTSSGSKSSPSTAARDRANSLGRTKSITRKLKGILGRSKDDVPSESKTATAPVAKSESSSGSKTAAAPASTNVKSVDISKQPEGQLKAPASIGNGDVASESSGEWVSEYEEVSDSEYENHKGDPNYLEVSDDEVEKYLKKSIVRK